MGDETIGKVQFGPGTTATAGGGTVRLDTNKKPPTRIEKLGELYDAAIENVKKRLAPPDAPIIVPEELQLIQAEHAMDMQVISTYLQETKRPERTTLTPTIYAGNRALDPNTGEWVDVVTST